MSSAGTAWGPRGDAPRIPAGRHLGRFALLVLGAVVAVDQLFLLHLAARHYYDAGGVPPSGAAPGAPTVPRNPPRHRDLLVLLRSGRDVSASRLGSIRETWAGSLHPDQLVIMGGDGGCARRYGDNHQEGLTCLEASMHVRIMNRTGYDWLLVVDDDVYVFADRLSALLGTLDADRRAAYGSPGCGDCGNGRVGFCGGGGYFLSRRSLLRMAGLGEGGTVTPGTAYSFIDHFMRKPDMEWCDVRFGCVAQEMGLNLVETPGMYGNPLESEDQERRIIELEEGEPPLVFHRVSNASHMHRIHRRAGSMPGTSSGIFESPDLNATSSFSSRETLSRAVNDYIACNQSVECKVELGYGHPIGNWRTDGVKDMSFLFENMEDFNEPLTRWNTAAVTSMANMFSNAASFNQPLTNFDTSRVKNFANMFAGSVFNQDISGWNISSATSMEYMFISNAAIDQELCAWGDYYSIHVDYTNMFYDARSCTKQVNTPQSSRGPWCSCRNAAGPTGPSTAGALGAREGLVSDRGIGASAARLDEPSADNDKAADKSEEDTLGLGGMDRSERMRCMRDKHTKPHGVMRSHLGQVFPGELKVDDFDSRGPLDGAACEGQPCGMLSESLHPGGESPCAREVPKLIHFIWLDHPLPKKYAANIARVMDVNRDWQILLWVNEKGKNVSSLTKILSGDGRKGLLRMLSVKYIEDFKDRFVNWDIIQNQPNVGARSDWYRLEVVYWYGGIYMDTDAHPVHSFSEYGGVFRWPFVSYSDPEGYGNLCNCVWSAEKRSPFLRLNFEGWREAHLKHDIPSGPMGCGVMTAAFTTYASQEILMIGQDYIFMKKDGVDPVMTMSFDGSWIEDGMFEGQEGKLIVTSPD